MRKVIWGAPSFWIERFPLYWGIDQGFFETQGIDLEIWYSYGGPELAQAAIEGKIHIGEMGLPPFLAAYQQGFEARIIGSSVIQQLDHYLAARPDLETITALKGCRIGMLSAGSCDDYFIRKMLSANGLNPEKDVNLVPLGDSYGKLSLFSKRQIEAAFVVEPQLSRGESEGLLKGIGRVSDYYPRYQWGIIFASTIWLQKENDLLMRLMHAFRKACRSIRDNPDATLSLGSNVYGMAPDIFKHALLRDLPRWEVDTRLDRVGLQNALDVQKTLGVPTSALSLNEMVQPLEF